MAVQPYELRMVDEDGYLGPVEGVVFVCTTSGCLLDVQPNRFVSIEDAEAFLQSLPQDARLYSGDDLQDRAFEWFTNREAAA